MAALPRLALLHYSASPMIGGVESVMATHARLLRDAGYDVRVIAGRGDADLVPEIDSRNPDVQRVMEAVGAGGDGAPWFEALRQTLGARLGELLRDRDVVIAHNVLTLPLNLPLNAALLDVDRPVISWTHDLVWTIPDLLHFNRPGWPCSLLGGRLPGVAYVAVSESTRRELAEALVIPAEEIDVVPNGIDPLAFGQVDDHVRRLLGAVDALDAEPLILVPQRVTQHKGLDMVIEAAASLVRRWPRLRVLVTGPLDPHDPTAAVLARRLLVMRAEHGLEGTVRFLFEVGSSGRAHDVSDADVAGLYRASDLVLLPGHVAGFGLPLLEAAVSRLPVVCSDLPVFREVAGEWAEIVPRHASGDEVAAAVERGLAGPSVRQRRTVMRRYSWPRILESIERTIAAAVARRSHARG
jgi:mannosylglucosylglycerate synthase